MPRGEILTSSQRMQFLAFPDDEGELIRRYTPPTTDLAFVRQHRYLLTRLLPCSICQTKGNVYAQMQLTRVGLPEDLS
jgi:Domain of unknown function (DUF4158)